MNAIVKLQVNDQRLIPSFAQAFSRKDTFLAELMQNGRRAGATELDVSYSAILDEDGDFHGTLVFRDNGKGVQHWQDLLSLADSGWDAAIQAKEAPFGIGFFACVSNARKVRVESGDKVLEFTREQALAFEDIEVKANTQVVSGTIITLSGVNLPDHDLERALERFARGFPISVKYNGKELERPDAEENLTHKDRGFAGVVHLPGVGLAAIQPYTQYGGDVRVYLLGICVDEDRYSKPNYSVVHLLPEVFPARMPDRDKLVDHDANIRKVKAALDAWRVEHFLSLKATMSPEALWKAMPDMCRLMLKGGHLNDVDMIPVEVLRPVGEVCFYEPEIYRGKLNLTGFLSRHDVEQGKVVLCRNLPDYRGEGGALAQTVAHHLGWVEAPDSAFHADHWALKEAISLIEEDDDFKEGEVRFESKNQGVAFIGNVDLEIHVTDEMTVVWKGHAVSLTKGAVIWFDESEERGTLVVAGSYNATVVTAMVDEFRGEFDAIDTNWFDESCFELSQVIDSLLSVSAADTLREYLRGESYRDLGNTQDTCVLAVNTQDKRLSCLDGSELLEAMNQYRDRKLSASAVGKLLLPLVQRLAEDDARKEDERLEALLSSCVYSNAAHQRLEEAKVSATDVKALLKGDFKARAHMCPNWENLRAEIEDAVPDAIEKVLAKANKE